MKIHKKEKGFTLIELLVVVAILGILAAVVVPNVSSFIGRGETEANETEAKNVRLAVTAVMAECGGSELDVAHGTVGSPALGTAAVDISGVTCTSCAAGETLQDFLEGANDMKCSYAFTASGSMAQSACT